MKGRNMAVINTGKKGSKEKKEISEMFDIVAFIEKCAADEDLEPWEGTLRQYLPMVQEDPTLTDASHARLWRMIETAGVKFDDKDERKEHPEYSFFTPELFGIDDTLASVMEYFKAAAAGSDVSRRILLLYGPTSSGKSQFAILLKEGLEKFSRTKAGRIFALKDCPMHENPLNAIPKAAREQLKRQHGINIEGDLCPRCAYRLKTEYNDDFMTLPVQRIFMSEANRIGIGTFQPSDPKCCSLDTIVLTDKGPRTMGAFGNKHNQDIETNIILPNGKIQKADKFYLYKNQPVKHIRTRLGYSITVTANHPLVVADELGQLNWTYAKEIKVGDYISLACGQGFGRRQDCDLSSKLAEFYGLYVAEGDFSKEYSVEINNISPYVHKIVKQAGLELGLKAHSYDKKVVLCSKELVTKMRLLGFETGAHKKSIPSFILTSGQLIPFLRGLWLGDGNCGRHATKRTNEATYSTVSKRLAEQVHVLLLALGIPANLQHEPNVGTRGAYKLVVGGKYAQKLTKILKMPNWKFTRPFDDEICHSTNVGLVPALNKLARLVCDSAKYMSPWHRYTCPEKAYGRGFTKKSLDHFYNDAKKGGADPVLLNRISTILDPNLLFLEVESVEDDVTDVADIRVPKAHMFVGHGFVSHNSQNQSELTGSVNFAKLAELGSESHPMAFDFNGELNKANRGMMEFIELLKVDRKFRHILLTLAQEKRIKAQNFPLIFADLVVISHTNETEYLKFLAQKEEEALHDRLWVVKFPYNLRLDSEIKIYEKLISHATGFQSIHIAPHTLRLAAMFAILSRLEEPKDQKFTMLTKMRLYNGEKIDGAGKEDEKKLREVAEREGMDGISPRYIVNRISACFTKYGKTYITPMDIVRSIKEGFSTNAKLSKDDIGRFENIITTVMEEYNKIATNEVQKAFFMNFEYEIKDLLNNYIDNVGAYLDDDKVKNEWGELEEPNHRLMRSVEEKIGVTDGGKDAFRQEVYRKMIKSKSDIGSYDYQSHPRLKEALQKQLFEERSDIIRLTVSVRNPDPEALKRLNEVIKTLSEKCGYTPESANDLLRYVSSIMAKNN
jgi:predicted Ser/Thr protein kinase/intein/homing endonuclease